MKTVLICPLHTVALSSLASTAQFGSLPQATFPGFPALLVGKHRFARFERFDIKHPGHDSGQGSRCAASIWNSFSAMSSKAPSLPSMRTTRHAAARSSCSDVFGSSIRARQDGRRSQTRINRHSPDSGVFAAKDRVSDRLGQVNRARRRSPASH